jgi:diguanylate cyclase (GGDEF)-like protein
VAGVGLTVAAALVVGVVAPGPWAGADRTDLGLVVALVLLAGITVYRTLSVSAAQKHQSLHDPLTGLPNRVLFQQHLDDLLAVAHLGTAPIAVLLIDLDRFKEVNDTLGHGAGDVLLKQIGPRLADSLDGDGVIARLGGDEFGVLLTGVDGPAAAQRRANALVVGLEQPFPVGGGLVDVEASIGIALSPEHGRTGEALLQRADVAMYLAKDRQHAVELYDPAHDHHSPHRLRLLADLRTALGSEQLVLHYQPQVDLLTGRVETVEALVRWQHPTLGLLSPGEFVPLAERTGLIRPLTTHVLAQSLRQIARWRDRGLDVTVSVNLSARNLHDPHLSTQLSEALARHHLPASSLQLEITESSIMSDPDRAATVLRSLDDLGVRLAIDDFGTGYSSLAYLQRLPVAEIKIDQSFVYGMAERASDQVIVRSTIDLARNLGLTVTAEGVESEAALVLLRDAGCHSVQGYFISAALPAAELEPLLLQRAWSQGVASGLARGQRSLFDLQADLAAEVDVDLDGDEVVLDLAHDPVIDLGRDRHPSGRPAPAPHLL